MSRARRGRKPAPRPSSERFPAWEALSDPVPVRDRSFAELPAQLHYLALAVSEEIDQALARVLELNAHLLQQAQRRRQLELGRLQPPPSILQILSLSGSRPRTLAPVLG